MIHRESGEMKGERGSGLFYRSWRPRSSKAMLVFVHGLSEHSGRYIQTAEYFAGVGFAVYLFDLRGHGQSPGRRGDIETLGDFIEDIDTILVRARREETAPAFLIGHSFGGQLVINYAAGIGRSRALRGMILSSPNIRLKVRISALKQKAVRVLTGVAPTLPLLNEIPAEGLSRDPRVVEEYLGDPLVQRKVTARLGTAILRNQREILELASSIQIPSLLMHAGADQICSPEATREFFQKIPIEEKTLKIYEGFYHELFNEPEKKGVCRDVAAWIEKRIA